MTLAPGTRLASYEVTAKLGQGGMGEVWRATDTRLKRDVAIKVLPAAFTADAERMARFEREAQLLARLQHPNVASIYGLEQSEGVRALVLELVEGEELSAHVARGALPLAEALPIAKQIAEALEAAHEQGLVHRDLKPANVKITPGGAVKVLDFGLARALDAAVDPARSTPMNSPTLTAAHGTQMGMILGTAAYMAPEQARGKGVDRRADIWAFGAVVYELLTGRRAFEGDEVSDVLAAVLRQEIDWSALPAGTPPAIRRLLRRCLERDPKNRLHDVADARIVIDEVLAGRLDEPAAIAPTAPTPARARWALVAGALVAGLALGVLVASLWNARSAADGTMPELTQFEVRGPEASSFVSGLALSPDGRKIAFVARDATGRTALWVRAFDALEPRKLPETDDARFPFWAPDSRRIGFFSGRSLKWIDSLGGTPIEVATTSSVQDVRGGAWGADDVILYTPTFTGPMLAVPARGGTGEPATRVTEDGTIGTTRFPSFLPDGRRFVYYAAAGTGTEPGEIWLGRLGSLDAKRLGPATSTAVFAEPGYLLYARGDSLVAHRLDDEREDWVGEPVPLGIGMGGSISVSGQRSLGVSSGGTLAYRADKRSATQIVWVDRAGKPLGSVTDAESTWHYAPRLSPDGRSMVVAQYASRGKLGEVWIYDLARKVANRVTFDLGDSYVSLWSRPDGREILVNSARAGSNGGIYRIAPERPDQARLWIDSDVFQIPVTATPDGRRIVFERIDDKGRIALWIRELEGQSEAVRLSPTNVAEFSGDLSPDGRWLAYASDATRTWEVYVRALDGGGGAVRISKDGGSQPLWRRDGRELFYVDTLGRLIAVPMAARDSPQPGSPQVLFEARLEEASDRQYDASSDGQRFLLNRSLTVDNVPIVVVLDWTALLERQAR